MRFVVFGAGAVGGVIAARLFEHGREVVAIARGAHFEAMRDDGLRLVDPANAVAAALSGATFESIPRPDVMRWKYAKLLMNLANAVEALFAPDDDATALGRLARREGAAVLRAAGIDFASIEEDRERR